MDNFLYFGAAEDNASAQFNVLWYIFVVTRMLDVLNYCNITCKSHSNSCITFLKIFSIVNACCSLKHFQFYFGVSYLIYEAVEQDVAISYMILIDCLALFLLHIASVFSPDIPNAIAKIHSSIHLMLVLVFGVVPFLKDIISRMLAMLGMVKQDNMKWVFAHCKYFNWALALLFLTGMSFFCCKSIDSLQCLILHHHMQWI